jgi:hypothetical protein
MAIWSLGSHYLQVYVFFFFFFFNFYFISILFLNKKILDTDVNDELYGTLCTFEYWNELVERWCVGNS